ncbi:MAG TPA: SDR family oxidoreductase [Pseudolysinimonas sp.]
MSDPESPAPDFSVAGQRVLVTGASRGIGRALCIAFAAAGADVVGVSRERPGVAGIEWVPGDLSDRAQGDQIVERFADQVDSLVCNAGIAARAPAEDHSDADWDGVLEVNLSSHFRLVRGIGKGMLARRQGNVVWIGSMMSFQGGRDVISYTASKSAAIGVVRALANEWAGRGVRVNAITPGYVTTDLTSGTHGVPERRAAIEARIPAGRWGDPRDVAGAAIFLCSPAASYVHGVALPVDGGWLAR